jgi:predicted RNA-binding protein YlqC (UPF0109 family)
MDQKRGPAKRDGGKPYKKGGSGGGGRGRFVRGGGGGRGPSQYGDPNSTAAEDLAEYVITVLARDPDAVQIMRSPGGHGRSRLTVQCDPAVTGRLIGKEGRTITALRQLVRAVAGRHGKRVDIEVALQNE